MTMTWQEICDDPQLRDLTFKIEQDRYGRIVMSPAGARHGRLQVEISVWLVALLPGWAVYSETGISTPEGVKVPDVSAMSPSRAGPSTGVVSLSIAPEICVEIASPRNSPAEFEEKRRLLTALGCVEFWVCSEAGKISFSDAVTGDPRTESLLCPTFPSQLAIE